MTAPISPLEPELHCEPLAEPREIPVRSLRILVVDDDPLLRTFIAARLSFDGHDVNTASDGLSALALHQDRAFEVVVADLFMPGMSGLELASAIKRLSASPPLICMTGASEAMENSPFDLILRKPFAHSVLQEALQLFCAGTLPVAAIKTSMKKQRAADKLQPPAPAGEPDGGKSGKSKPEAIVNAACYCGSGVPFRLCCGNDRD